MSDHVAVEGRGVPCLVPVPSLPSAQQSEFAADLRRSICFGFTRVPGRRPCTPNSVIGDMEEGRLALGAERVHVLGTSSLGFVAAHYARACPDHVASVILAATPVSLQDLEAHQSFHWDRNASEQRKAQLRRNLARIQPDLLTGSRRLLGMARAYAPQSWMDPGFDPTPLAEAVDPEALNAFRSINLQSIAGGDMTSLLEELSCPVLQIHGRHDFVAPLPPWEASAARVSRRVVLERSAHHPYFEEPDAFANEILSWIASTPAA